jgi:ribose transport system substrate-binding protein
MESWLQAHPDAGDIVGVWAVYDQPALGAVQAIHEAGLKNDIVVVGADGDKQNIVQYVKNGITQLGTVAQDPAMMGKICATVAVEYLNGKTDFPGTMYADLTLVTQENATSFIEEHWGAE